MKLEAAFGKRLKYALKMQKMSSAALAEKTGISSSSISRYVNGKIIPNRKYINIIADTLNVDPMWLIGRIDDNDDVSIQKEDDQITEAVRRRLTELINYLKSEKEINPLLIYLDNLNKDQRYIILDERLDGYQYYYDIKTDTFIACSKTAKFISINIYNKNHKFHRHLLKEFEDNLAIKDIE